MIESCICPKCKSLAIKVITNAILKTECLRCNYENIESKYIIEPKIKSNGIQSSRSTDILIH